MIIGAGAAGLAALRHTAVETYKDNVICFEKTDEIGGTWVYKSATGIDSYGLPIHTSMYQSLRWGFFFFVMFTLFHLLCESLMI